MYEYVTPTRTKDPNTTMLKVPCSFCGRLYGLYVNTKEWLVGLEAHKNGASIEDVWPTITPDIRRMLSTGICEECWRHNFEKRQ